VAPCFSTISKTATEFIEVFTYPSLSTVEDGLGVSHGLGQLGRKRRPRARIE